MRVVGGCPLGGGREEPWAQAPGTTTQVGGGLGLGGGAEPTHHRLWLSTCHQQPPVSPQMCSNSWCHPDSWRSSPLRK